VTCFIPFATDWEVYFRPITLGWLDGSLTLYQDTGWGAGFWNPPWLLWMLIPLATMPVWLGWGLLVVATVFVMLWLTKSHEGHWLVFVTPLLVFLVVFGQVEIVPMLGIALGWLAADRPHLLGISLVLMAAKPQPCFLVAIWLLLRHSRRFQAMVVPASFLLISLCIHGWDWPLRWANNPSILDLIHIGNNSTPWHSLGLWMLPVSVLLSVWVLSLPRTRRNLGAVVAANALVTPYMSSYGLVQVLAFSMLPLGRAWAIAAWAAGCTPLLRAVYGPHAARLDFAIAAVLMIGYLLRADRISSRPDAEEQVNG
jgi:hypothetical protein